METSDAFVEPPKIATKSIHYVVNIEGIKYQEFDIELSAFAEKAFLPYTLSSGENIVIFKNGKYETKAMWDERESQTGSDRPFPTKETITKTEKKEPIDSFKVPAFTVFDEPSESKFTSISMPGMTIGPDGISMPGLTIGPGGISMPGMTIGGVHGGRAVSVVNAGPYSKVTKSGTKISIGNVSAVGKNASAFGYVGRGGEDVEVQNVSAIATGPGSVAVACGYSDSMSVTARMVPLRSDTLEKEPT